MKLKYYPGRRFIRETGTSRGTRASGTPKIETTRRSVTDFPTTNLSWNTSQIYTAKIER